MEKNKLLEKENRFHDVISTSQKKPWYLLLGVWLGFIIVVGTMAAGGSLSTMVNFKDLFILTLLANLILGGVAGIFGYIGAKSGRSFASFVNLIFPGTSSKVVSFYVPLILVFWFSVLSSILGQYLVGFFGFSDVWIMPISIVLCFVLSITSYFGITALGYLSIVAVPFIMGLIGYSVMNFVLPTFTMTSQLGNFTMVNTVLGIIVSTWIMGATINILDITRYAKTPMIGGLIAFFGIVLGNSFNILIGAWAALVGGTSDPAQLLIGLGLPFFGFLLVILNIWTTNDNNMYSSSVGMANVLSISRKKSVLFLSFFAVLFVVFGVSGINNIMQAILVMGSTAPALGAVVLSGYLLMNKFENFKFNSLFGWVAWILASVVGIYFEGLIGIVVAFVLSLAIHYSLSSYFVEVV